MRDREQGLTVRSALRIGMSALRERLGRHFVAVPFDESGTIVVVDLRTAFGKRVYRYGPYVDPDFDILRRFLRPGDVFVDCGANLGQFTLTAARLVGPTGIVVAYEPSPHTYASLRRNVDANGFANVQLHQLALGARSSVATFVAMPDSGGLSSFAPAEPSLGTVVDVAVVALDDELDDGLRRRVALVKIDVEGAELQLLAGASSLLTSQRPPVLIEIEDEHLRRQGGSAVEVAEFLGDLGYDECSRSATSPNVLYVHPGNHRP
jgi:FkbM family methyltransferase